MSLLPPHLSLSLGRSPNSVQFPMSRRSTIFTYIGCLLVVVLFQYVALVWSFADFHPGGDVPPDSVLTHRAELGAAMHQPFRVPLEWMRSAAVQLTGGYDFVSSSAYSTLYQWVHWLLLPLIYGTILFIIMRLLFRFFSSHVRPASS